MADLRFPVACVFLVARTLWFALSALVRARHCRQLVVCMYCSRARVSDLPRDISSCLPPPSLITKLLVYLLPSAIVKLLVFACPHPSSPNFSFRTPPQMAIAPQGDELTPLATFTNIFFSKLFEQIPETKVRVVVCQPLRT